MGLNIENIIMQFCRGKKCEVFLHFAFHSFPHITFSPHIHTEIVISEWKWKLMDTVSPYRPIVDWIKFVIAINGEQLQEYHFHVFNRFLNFKVKKCVKLNIMWFNLFLSMFLILSTFSCKIKLIVKNTKYLQTNVEISISWRIHNKN